MSDSIQVGVEVVGNAVSCNHLCKVSSVFMSDHGGPERPVHECVYILRRLGILKVLMMLRA